MPGSLISELPRLAGGSLLGGAVGLLTGFFGAGGGFILTPALHIVLGLPMHLAAGTSAFQMTGVSLFSLIDRLDRRLLGIRVALCLGIGVPFGSLAGTRLVRSIKQMRGWSLDGRAIDPVNFSLMACFAVFLLGIAAWMCYDTFFRKPRPGAVAGVRLAIPPLGRFRTIPAGPYSIPVLALLGVAIGLLSGLLGIGGGVIVLPALFYLVGQETRAATQTSLMVVLLSGLSSSLFHARDGNIDYLLVAALLPGAMIGARIGLRLQRAVSERAIRRGFALVTLGAWLLVMSSLWRMLT